MRRSERRRRGGDAGLVDVFGVVAEAHAGVVRQRAARPTRAIAARTTSVGVDAQSSSSGGTTTSGGVERTRPERAHDLRAWCGDPAPAPRRQSATRRTSLTGTSSASSTSSSRNRLRGSSRRAPSTSSSTTSADDVAARRRAATRRRRTVSMVARPAASGASRTSARTRSSGRRGWIAAPVPSNVQLVAREQRRRRTRRELHRPPVASR